MRTKQNSRKLVHKQDVHIIKAFGVVALTLAALVLTSIIGPTASRNGKVQAFAGTATLDLQNLTFTDSSGTSPVQWINTTVPGFPYNIAKYHSEFSNEGIRGDVDANISRFNLSCPDPYGYCNSCSNHTATPVTDDNLGNQTFGADPTNSALDHRWVQGHPVLPLIYELQASSSNAVVFPAHDHRDGGPYESLEFTVWGYTGAGTPNPANFPTGWIQGRLNRVYQDGWHQHTGAYAQTFNGGAGGVFTGLGFETDDFASVWSFINPSTNQPLSVVFVAIYSNKSMAITPNLGNPYDSENCPADYFNDGFNDGIFTSNDCEIDAVATTNAIQGCVDPSCAPPPPPPPPPCTDFSTYTVLQIKQTHCAGDEANDSCSNTSNVPVSVYLQQNFDTLFPNGLTIGVNDGNGSKHHAIWNNVCRMQGYLCVLGIPGKLYCDTLNASNQLQTGGGTLPSEVIALGVNLRLNCADFGNLVLCHTGCSGLDGKSIQTVFNQANLFLANAPGYCLGLDFLSLNALIDNLNRSYLGCSQSCFARDHLRIGQ